MTISIRLLGLALGLFALVILIASSAFIVTPRNQALVLQFGEAKRIVTEPGLNFKVPLLQNVKFYAVRPCVDYREWYTK